MALLLPTNHSAQQSCPLWRDMSVTTGGGGQKVTDTSKPVKNVMVFVKDLASAVAAVKHHSWIRCFGSSGEMVNIKGLCRSLPFRRLLTGDLFMTFSKGGGIHDGSPFFESQDNPCHGGGEGPAHTVSGLQIYCCHQSCAAASIHHTGPFICGPGCNKAVLAQITRKELIKAAKKMDSQHSRSREDVRVWLQTFQPIH